MSSLELSLEQFSEKARLAEAKVCENLSPAYLDGLLSRLFGGVEMRQIVQSVGDDSSSKMEVSGFLQQSCGFLYTESKILNHALSKPRGYPGDFELLEYVYDCSPHFGTSSELGISIDRWALNLSLPRAVRSRKNSLLFLIYDLLAAFKGPHYKVLSLGAGGARELRELPRDALERMDITLVDKDVSALEYATAELVKRAPNIKIKTKHCDFYRLSTNDTFDLIYSFGVFDYLGDRVVKRCICRFQHNLTNSGHFVYSIKNSIRYDNWFYDLFANWSFIQRDVKTGAALIDGSNLVLQGAQMLESDVAIIYVASKSGV